MVKITLTSSSTPYQVRSDRVSNFVVFNSGYFYWANLDFNRYLRSVQAMGDIDIDSMQDLALSSNKMVVFFDDHVAYYQIVGSDLVSSGSSTAEIQLITSKTFTATIDDGQFRFTLGCICQGLKRFSCYSSTLNCLIIKAADTECGTKDIPVAEIVVN